MRLSLPIPSRGLSGLGMRPRQHASGGPGGDGQVDASWLELLEQRRVAQERELGTRRAELAEERRALREREIAADERERLAAAHDQRVAGRIAALERQLADRETDAVRELRNRAQALAFRLEQVEAERLAERDTTEALRRELLARRAALREREVALAARTAQGERPAGRTAAAAAGLDLAEELEERARALTARAADIEERGREQSAELFGRWEALATARASLREREIELEQRERAVAEQETPTPAPPRLGPAPAAVADLEAQRGALVRRLEAIEQERLRQLEALEERRQELAGRRAQLQERAVALGERLLLVARRETALTTLLEAAMPALRQLAVRDRTLRRDAATDLEQVAAAALVAADGAPAELEHALRELAAFTETVAA